MYNHEPENYTCPLCLAVKGIENDKVQTRQADIIYKDDKLYELVNDRRLTDPKERIPYADRLKRYFEK